MDKWRLRYYGDPVLRTKSTPIEEITDEIKELAQFMIAFIDSHNGIGLAAPQLGVPIRLFVLRDYLIDEDGKWSISETPKVFINPKILDKSEETDLDMEGCLSVPGGTYGPIERPIWIKIEATDLEGNRFEEEREGINARVTFHENDHLNGVLQIDRMPPRERKKIEPKLRAIKQKYSNE
jgi:peptide deformylase